MRWNVAVLAVLMAMLACLAVFRLRPPGLVPFPGNFVLAALLCIGTIAVALRRPYAYPVGLAAAVCASLGGVLSYRGWLGTNLPGYPVVWIVAGLYIAFRLTVNRHAEDRKRPAQPDRPDA